MSEQTLAQKRAADALQKVTELQRTKDYGNYKSYVSGLPANILMSGLGQAVATVLASAKLGKNSRSKDNIAYETLYNHLSSWLCKNEDDAPYPDASDLMVAITSGTEDDYIHAQAEAMAYLEWLKKFAVAFLEKGKEN